LYLDKTGLSHVDDPVFFLGKIKEPRCPRVSCGINFPIDGSSVCGHG